MSLKQFSKVSEIQLVYKTKIKATQRPRVSESKESYHILKEYYGEDEVEFRESFSILLLNRANRVLGHVLIGTGNTAGVLVDIKFILVSACKANASSVILCHNHPSGNLKPSSQDLNMTRKVKEALQLVDISLLDHIIIIKDDYSSLADEGLI